MVASINDYQQHANLSYSDLLQVTITVFEKIIVGKALVTLVFGLRPVANIMCEKPSSVPLLVFKDNEPSEDLRIA